jgi:hypothetical protein
MSLPGNSSPSWKHPALIAIQVSETRGKPIPGRLMSASPRTTVVGWGLPHRIGQITHSYRSSVAVYELVNWWGRAPPYSASLVGLYGAAFLSILIHASVRQAAYY